MIRNERHALNYTSSRQQGEQDYRHEKRKVFNNRNVILEVVKIGRITGLEIKEALNKR